MTRKFVCAVTFAALFFSAGVHAEGGGGGSPTTNQEVANCVQRGTDGKAVQKLSSEDVCPMYQFWREDCTRAGKTREMAALGHCSPDAMGMGQDDLATGSIARPR